ncbi:uncharacterized protein Hyls1 [Planococcus citri]|uniref:uncharacterized protein Hyls1 n=1 Tax=Planococcus citri TaxID=170843 RepID=UPI0031FA36AE
MSIRIDSSEVLHHLNSYGIHSIDDNSLKSFIKDLKKLIKYEHYKNVSDVKFEESNPPHERNSLTKGDLSSVVHDNRRKHSCCRKKLKENVRPIYSEELPNNNRVHYQKIKSICPCRTTPSQPAIQCSEITSPKPSCKCKHDADLNDDNVKSTNDKLREEACHIKRPTSLLSSTRSQATNVRTKKGHCDPVELYHYYQSFWKNHKLPGENDHAQLRLAIRKRLMNVK